MYRIVFLAILLGLWSNVSYAQPTLPEVATMTQGGINILSWTNPNVNNVKAVVVQRSKDSTLNYVTIGSVADISRSSQFFTDATGIEGNNFYRVKVVYDGGFEWVSNTVLIHLDSHDVADRKVLPSNDSLQKLIASMSTNGTPNIAQINNMGYTPSRYVFSNPFNGHVNIELENTLTNKYVIKFFSDQRLVLEIPRVNEDEVILDKRNFQMKGIYRFTVWKNDKEFESGVISIY